MLIEHIGLPAMLEQTAEECTELAYACLKYARELRNENPTFRYESETELIANLNEEVADVKICIKELKCILYEADIEWWKAQKIEYMKRRFAKREET